MAVTATRQVVIGFSGDITASFTFAAATNTDSPGAFEVKALVNGANTITPPAGVTPKACTIIPPSGNTVTLTLKGVTGDTGVGLHLTDPTTIALASPTATFVITTNGTMNIRLVWS